MSVRRPVPGQPRPAPTGAAVRDSGTVRAQMETGMERPASHRRARPAPVALVAGAVLALAGAAAAQTNGGFENGVLAPWVAGGSAGVEVLQATALNPSIAPPEGSFFALLSTGPGDRPGDDAGDRDGNGVPEYDTTTLSYDFTTPSPGQALSLRWAFLTSEETEQDPFDDILEVRVDGVTVLARSVRKPGGGSPFPDVPAADGVARTVTSSGTTNGSSYVDGASPFDQLCVVIATAGSHTLEVAVADQADQLVDSGVLIDDLRVPSTCAGTVQLTDTSGSELGLKGGGLEWRPHLSGSRLGSPASVSADGSVVGYLSTGNPTGDNPGAQVQVFVADADSVERLTAIVDGAARGPSLSATGRWVAFSATDDPVGGNPEGNLELFRRDLLLGTTDQLTTTSGCENASPGLSGADGGRRLAFTTDCTDLAPGFNGDGNREVVVWDDLSGLRLRETAGCTNLAPAISEDGSTVAFVSDCDLTGQNPDRNLELFTWAPDTATVSQRTVTTVDAVGNPAVSDGPSLSADGSRIAFVSTADLTGANPFGSLEAFLWDGGGFTQLTDGSPLDLHLVARIDRSGTAVAVEWLDLSTATGGVAVVDLSSGTLSPLAAGDAAQPAIAVDSGTAIVVWESSADPLGLNPDGNVELFRSATVLDATGDLCRTPALAIPDSSPPGVSDDLVLGPGGTLTDLDLALVIDHTYVNDLVVVLTHVATGTSVTVVDRIRRNPVQPCTRDDIDAVLDDEGARDVQTECANNGADPTVLSPPSFVPNEPLAAFDGELLEGTWRLTVSDIVGLDTGVLQEWCLVPETAP